MLAMFEFISSILSSRHILFAMACDYYFKVLSFCSLHFRIAAKIRLDLVNQINPQCNSVSGFMSGMNLGPI